MTRGRVFLTWTGAIFVAFMLAAFLPLIELGIYFRLLMMFFGIVAIVLIWGMRKEGNIYPEKFIYYLLIFTVLLSFCWPRYVFYKLGPLPRINPYTTLIIITTLMIVISWIYSPKLSNRVNSVIRTESGIFSLISIWFSWRLLDCFFGNETAYSISVYYRELMYVCSFVLIGIALSLYKGTHLLLYKTLVIVGVFLALAGIYESITQFNPFVGLASQDEDGQVSRLLANIAIDKSRNGAFRTQVIFDHPIVFGQFLAAVLPFCLLMLIRDRHWLMKVLAMLSLSLSLVAIYKSGARSGLVGAAVGITLFSVVLWSRAVCTGYLMRIISLLLVPVMFVGAGVSYYIISSLVGGQSAIENQSGLLRVTMVENGIAALWDSPLVGFGEGMSPYIAGVKNPAGTLTIDSYYLSLALDGGYVGLALFLSIMAIFMYKAFRHSITNRGDDALYVAASVSSIAAILSVFSIVSISNNMTLLWIIMMSCLPFFQTRKMKQ